MRDIEIIKFIDSVCPIDLRLLRMICAVIEIRCVST